MKIKLTTEKDYKTNTVYATASLAESDLIFVGEGYHEDDFKAKDLAIKDLCNKLAYKASKKEEIVDISLNSYGFDNLDSDLISKIIR